MPEVPAKRVLKLTFLKDFRGKKTLQTVDAMCIRTSRPEKNRNKRTRHRVDTKLHQCLQDRANRQPRDQALIWEMLDPMCCVNIRQVPHNY